MNNVGTALKEFVDNQNKLSSSFSAVGQFDRINKSFRFMKGADAMTVNKFKELSTRSALPTFEKQTAIQRGNSTHKSLFGVAFFIYIPSKSICSKMG